jgi:hypothetical protein
MFVLIGVVYVLVGADQVKVCGLPTVWEHPFPSRALCQARKMALDEVIAPREVPLAGKFECVEEDEIL